MRFPVSSLLARKDGALIEIGPDATVFDAIRTMVEHNVGSILVTDGGALAGIFTERDYLRRIALEGRTSRETRLKDVMTTDLVTVGPDTPIDACLALMTRHKIRHLPVLRGDAVAGVVSIGDCVRARLDEARAEAEELQRFVSGDYTS